MFLRLAGNRLINLYRVTSLFAFRDEKGQPVVRFQLGATHHEDERFEREGEEIQFVGAIEATLREATLRSQPLLFEPFKPKD